MKRMIAVLLMAALFPALVVAQNPIPATPPAQTAPPPQPPPPPATDQEHSLRIGPRRLGGTANCNCATTSPEGMIS